MAFFKSISNKSIKNIGDAYWNSSNGQVSLLIDAVTNTPNPGKTKEIILDFLYSNEERLLALHSDEIISQINSHLILHGEMQTLAVLVLAYHHQEQIYLSWIGNPRCYRVTKSLITNIIEPLRAPEEVAGLKYNVKINTLTLEIDEESFFIISSDGITLLDNTSIPNSLSQMSDMDWAEWGNSVQIEDDWSFSVFPFEKLITHQDSNWPYNPFIGEQEEKQHEKLGLARIANELFKHHDFDGFKIIGGSAFSTKNSIRKSDGILVSPYGITVLELKDHWGKITVSTTNRGKMKVVNDDSTYFEETSPYYKLHEIITPFSDQNSLKDIISRVEQRRLGAVVFTNPLANVAITTLDVDYDMPARVGYIIITSASDLAAEIRRYAKQTIGKSSKLAQETIESVCKILQGNPSKDESEEIKLKGRYVFNPNQALEDESTDYYRTYLGHDTRKNKSVWIKKYTLSSMSRGSLEEEALRIGREAEALKEFASCPQVQVFVDSDQIGDEYYIVVECIEGKNIDQWLTLKPSLSEKYAVLLSIANLMIEIENVGIAHRAINNKNLRIDATGNAKLINFELSKFDYLPTLPPSIRLSMDGKFQSREVRSAVSQDITTASDMFSFGILICYILSGEIVITQDELLKFARNPKKWAETAEKCGIASEHFLSLIPLFDMNPVKRLNANQILNTLEEWYAYYAK